MSLFLRAVRLSAAIAIALTLVVALYQITAANPQASSDTQIIINAVLYHGQASGQGDEAVQLRNTTSATLSIAGWWVRDQQNTQVILPSGAELASGESVWLTRNAVPLKPSLVLKQISSTLTPIPLCQTWRAVGRCWPTRGIRWC